MGHFFPTERFSFFKEKKQIVKSQEVLIETNKSVQREWERKKPVWELWYGGNNLTLTVLIIVVALGLSVWEEGAFEPYREVGYRQQDDPFPESACSGCSLVTACVIPTAAMERGLNSVRDLGLRPSSANYWCDVLWGGHWTFLAFTFY